MEIPEYETRKLSDAERFVIGFKQLVDETNLTQVGGTKVGLNKFIFKDGSYFGLGWLMSQIGCDEFLN